MPLAKHERCTRAFVKRFIAKYVVDTIRCVGTVIKAPGRFLGYFLCTSVTRYVELPVRVAIF